MNCTHAREHLAVFADAQLPAALGFDLEAHLAGCADCRGQVAFWRSVRQSARRAVTLSTLPAGLRDRIVARISRRAGRERTLWASGNALVAAAALILMSVVAWRYWDDAPRAYKPMALTPPLAVSPAQLAGMFVTCAEKGPHDMFVHQRPRGEVLPELAEHVGCEVLLPDLAGAGYRLVAACNCSRIPGVHAIQAVYARGLTIMLVVSIESCISVGESDTACDVPCRRRYERADDQGVNIVKWNHGRGSYAVCARMSSNEISAITDRTDFDFMPCVGANKWTAP